MTTKAKTATRSKAKRKTLPKDFEKMLERGAALDELKAVFDRCVVNAHDGYSQRTALMMSVCPDELTRWLVANGADLTAVDRWGKTPLYVRAASRRQPSGVRVLLELGAGANATSGTVSTPLHSAVQAKSVENVETLLAFGAEIDAPNSEGLTPLELGLRGCTNIELVEMAKVAKVLLAHGARRKPSMNGFVKHLGETFEFHRAGFNKDYVNETSTALMEIYGLFCVEPVPRREMHDRVALITVSATSWQRRHDELWALLVPSRGPAATIQGEVIRISGRIGDEIHRNGGRNWDRDYTTMAKSFLALIQTGKALPVGAVQICEDVVASLIAHRYGDTAPLAENAVAWVLLNPRTVPLGPVRYAR